MYEFIKLMLASVVPSLILALHSGDALTNQGIFYIGQIDGRHQRARTSIAMVATIYLTAGSPHTGSLRVEPAQTVPTRPHHKLHG